MPPIPILGRKPEMKAMQVSVNGGAGGLVSLTVGPVVVQLQPEGAVKIARALMHYAGHEMVLLQEQPKPGEPDENPQAAQ